MRMGALGVVSVCLTALASGASAGSLVWKNRLPSERSNVGLAYDSARHKAVAFGGQLKSNGSYTNETWEWDGANWNQRAVTGPSARSSFAMAYDPVRQKTVLFGGMNTAGYSDETWEWDGQSWTKLAVPGPTARTDAEMCFDSTRNVMVMFGGWDLTYLADTWEWDGAAWTKREVTGPTGRRAYALSFDSAHGKTVMNGGLRRNPANGQPLLTNETWTFDGTTWVQGPAGPAATSSSSSAYDSARGVNVFFGGRLSTSTFNTSKEVWEWNGTVWTKRTPNAERGRSGHAMAYVPESGGVIVFGGPTSDGFIVERADTQLWSGSGWGGVASQGPRARTGLGMAYDSIRERTVVASGYYDTIGDFWSIPDAWEWNGFTWTQQGTAPALYRGGMTFDSARGVAVYYGGISDARNISGATWESDGVGGFVDRGIPGPSPRTFPAMAYDSARHFVVLFGGASTDFSGALGGTWEYDGNTWIQYLLASEPSPRIGASLAYDSARGVTVLFGGRPNSSGPFSNETWEWNGSSWTQRMVAGPPARSEAGMAYDPVRGKTVLFGGWNSSTLITDTWEWDGSSWTQLPITGPKAGWSGGLVYDTKRQAIVAFGGAGVGTSYSSEIWELSVVCPADLNADHVVDDADFGIFAPAYDTLDCADPAMAIGCPADLNSDGFVDDADFVLFVAAYDVLLCV